MMLPASPEGTEWRLGLPLLAGVLEGRDLPALAVLNQHEGLHGLVVRPCRALAGERHRPREDHDGDIRADEPRRSRRRGFRVVIDQHHPGAGQWSGEKRPVAVFDGLPAAPVRSGPGDEVGIVGEKRRVAGGIAAVPGVLQCLAKLTNYFPRKEDLVFDRAEAIIASLADAVAARAPGESLLAAVRRDYAERIAAGDVTLGVPTRALARMVDASHTLTSRRREIAELTEQALGDAIAVEAGGDDLQLRVVAAQLASVHRVLFADGTRRVLAGQPRDEIGKALAAAASLAFDLLEPSLGGYRVRG